MRPSHSKRLTRQGRRVSTATAAVLLGLTASLGCDKYPTNTARGVNVALGNATLSMAPGQSTTVPIFVQRVGYEGPFLLSVAGAPNGVTASIDPDVVSADAEGATLTLSLANTAAVGTFRLNVSANLPWIGRPRSGSYLRVNIADRPTLKIQGPDWGFAVVVQGRTSTATFGIYRSGGFAGPVEFSVEGLPVGVTAVFDTRALAPTFEAYTETDMTLRAAADAPLVDDTKITVRARGEGVADAVVTVQLAVVDEDWGW